MGEEKKRSKVRESERSERGEKRKRKESNLIIEYSIVR